MWGIGVYCTKLTILCFRFKHLLIRSFIFKLISDGKSGTFIIGNVYKYQKNLILNEKNKLVLTYRKK